MGSPLQEPGLYRSHHSITDRQFLMDILRSVRSCPSAHFASAHIIKDACLNNLPPQFLFSCPIQLNLCAKKWLLAQRRTGDEEILIVRQAIVTAKPQPKTMELNNLSAISPIDGRYRKQL